MRFDSLSEENFYKRNQSILTIPEDRFFQQSFRDVDDTSFNAAYDFLLGAFYIEYKCHQLNTIETKQQASLKRAQQAPYINASNAQYKSLQLDWNHSLYKHKAVQDVLGDLYIIVFDDKTKLTKRFANTLDRHNINWCFESDLPSINNCNLH